VLIEMRFLVCASAAAKPKAAIKAANAAIARFMVSVSSGFSL
jgi:hypothetical protein